MKRIISKVFVLAFSLLMLGSCQSVLEEPVIEQTTTPAVAESTVHSPYHISEEQALKNLDNFLNSLEPATRGEKRTIAKISPIKLGHATRSENNDSTNEEILYIVNFNDERGYAILSADTRIPEDVLALIEEGNISDAEIYEAMYRATHDEPQERTIYSNYPTTGPGFFTDPEFGDELFLNPNTIDFYDAEYDDTWIGNFSEFGPFDDLSEGNVMAPDPIEGDEIPILTTGRCINYAITTISNEKDISFLSPFIEGGQEIIKTYGDWEITESKSNLLSFARRWTQHSPFNDLCPNVRRYIVCGPSRKAPAGCVPLAIAKIMAYFQYPNPYDANDYRVDWTSLRRNFLSDSGSLSAKNLIKEISKKCLSLHFYSGTFTLPCLAERYLDHRGYKDAESKKYNWDDVKYMISNNQPVIIYACPGKWNIKEAHCWNIDGYKVNERTVSWKTYINGKPENFQSTETQRMVHCDFGWGGDYNGYYVDGIFDLGNAHNEFDNTHTGASYYYKNHIRIIKYNKPY